MQRIGDSLKDKRVLITQSNDFMGPALCDAFKFYGAQVITSEVPLLTLSDIKNLDKNVDILILNLCYHMTMSDSWNVDTCHWKSTFAHLVDPLPRIAKHFFPNMIEKKFGKVLVIGSATAFMGDKGDSVYNTARAAQVAWVRKAGVEMAKHNVQINIIAQAFIDNPEFFPQSYKSTDTFTKEILDLPVQRLGNAEECTQLAIFLSCFESNFFVGQCFPISGGLII